MLRHLPPYAGVIAFLLLLDSLAGSAWTAESFVDGWEDVDADQTTWAAHYRKTARVKLGREQRLSNGIAWRLQTWAPISRCRA
jgi:hypothetical protein